MALINSASAHDPHSNNTYISSNPNITNSQIIRAAGDHNYPPYEFLDPSGQPTGFNVDIFRAVCEALKIKYQINLDSWDTVRKHLENGEIDVITGMYFSPERDKRVDFSTPHIIVSHSLFVHKNSNIKTLEDLSGKEVLVQQGDIMHDFLQSQGRSLAIIPV
ncbi:MAG: transporter substrate-binding domain-containing protein, partial [Desulfamplus sp.]|nr:transporter substrate-binding domain-containing protein [Desulfamplus sp.]